MSRSVSLLLFAALLCALSSRASAHLGHGSEIEARVFDDKIRVVLRMAVINAWSLMGDAAPQTFDEPGQAAAIPRLRNLAPDLLLLRRNGVSLKPREVDAVIGVDEHVAFVYVFTLPDAWPVEVEAGFLKFLGDMETARLKAFDDVGASPGKDAEAFLIKNLYRGNFRATMDLPRAGVSRVSPPIFENTPGNAANQSRSITGWGVGIGTAVGVVACLAWFGSRRGRKS